MGGRPGIGGGFDSSHCPLVGTFDRFKSAYEVKNNLCLFESLFKIQKNGVFLFEISFFILEISTIFYYANLISDDVILFATKMWKILNKQYLWKY